MCDGHLQQQRKESAEFKYHFLIITIKKLWTIEGSKQAPGRGTNINYIYLITFTDTFSQGGMQFWQGGVLKKFLHITSENLLRPTWLTPPSVGIPEDL